MARNKNATALFEVIHTAKRPPKASPNGAGMPTPKWWSRGGAKGDEAADPTGADASPTPAAETSGGTRRSWLSAARRPADAARSTDESAVVDAYDDRHDDDPDDGPAAREPTRREPAEPESDDAGPAVVITKYYPSDTPDAVAADDEPAVHDEDAPTAAPAVADEPSADAKPSWATRRAKVVADRAATTPAESSSSFDPTANVSPADLRAERLARRVVAPVAADAPAEPRKPRRSAGPRPSALKPDVEPALSVDRTAGEVRVRLSYGGAIAAGVILLVVLVIAYLVGQRSGPAAESAAIDPSVGQMRPAVASPTASAPNQMMAAAGPAAPSPAVAPAPLMRPAATAVVPVAAVPVAEPPAPRQAGMMYVVVQYYPDRETSNRAAAFLTARGLPCSVVAGPAGGALGGWYAVTGQRAFPHNAHGEAVQKYLAGIAELGPKFDTRVYNQFQPRLYTWRAGTDAP